PGARRGRAANYTTLRLWHPVAPNRMEVWSWFLVERSAPDWFQQAAYETYVTKIGAGGTFEQDDTEIWTRITRARGGVRGRALELNYQMGIGAEARSDCPGPGRAYSLSYSEANQRGFLARWHALLAGGA